MKQFPTLTVLSLGVALSALSACDKPLDYDLRGGKALNTSQAAINATEQRPTPDARGIISYPGYQVAVAQRGDTLGSLANRIGANPAELARYNGLEPDQALREGEIVALKSRVAEPAGGPITPKKPVDIAAVAGPAIDSAAAAKVETTPLAPAATAAPESGTEPRRHTVQRGETAYSISRLYNVSVRSLSEWNGLGPEYKIREGQKLLIPVPKAEPPKAPPSAVIAAPGVGSATPTPPSASKPLPKADVKPAKAEPPKPSSAPDLGSTQSSSASAARMTTPVQGSIVRPYKKGKNEGIDIAAAPGAAVKAAEAGTVAAVTQDTDGVPIVVIKHSGDLLTVYSNVDSLKIKKGDKVSRGQQIASALSNNTAVHFEIRKGFDSVDPEPYLN